MTARLTQRTIIFTIVLLHATHAGAVLVREDADTQVFLAGFMDVVFASRTADPEQPLLAVNQAEISVETVVTPRIALSITPAWDGEAMSLATAYVQFDRHATDEYYFSRHLSGYGVLVGRFDVPFGLDWMTYPSIDRPLITPPDAVLGTHGGWNADGVAVLGCFGIVNGILHATSGYDFARETTGGGGQQWQARHAEGGRVGLVPVTGLCLGASGAVVTAAHDRELLLSGLDAMLRTGRLDLRAEIIRHRTEADGLRTTDEGWYVQGQWDLGPAYAIARWDVMLDGVDDARSLSLGAGVPLNPWVILRGEYRAAVAGTGQDTWYVQLAAGF